jgi:transposase InsO family protein
LTCQFITEHREEFGVVPICRALSSLGVPIAPRTYHAHMRRAPSKRALWDLTVTELLAGFYTPHGRGRRPPQSLYGSLKMWAHLQRLGVPVARCTVERLMREHGWRGVTRLRKIRTTVADPAAARAPDLVRRHFTATRPDALWVSDFTYVAMTEARFGYTAFVIDAFAGRIVGWQCATSKHTGFVTSAVRQAVAARRRQGHPLRATVYHSDAGSQYTSVRFGQTLLLEGLTASVGTVADALDNALAETTIGLYKTECVRHGSPFRESPLQTLADLEEMTSAWVHWYNTDRLMHRLGRIPPAEAEAAYYTMSNTATPAAHKK